MGLAHEKKSYLQEKANLFEIGSTNIQKSQKKDDGRIPSRTVSFRPPCNAELQKKP